MKFEKWVEVFCGKLNELNIFLVRFEKKVRFFLEINSFIIIEVKKN